MTSYRKAGRLIDEGYENDEEVIAIAKRTRTRESSYEGAYLDALSSGESPCNYLDALGPEEIPPTKSFPSKFKSGGLPLPKSKGFPPTKSLPSKSAGTEGGYSRPIPSPPATVEQMTVVPRPSDLFQISWFKLNNRTGKGIQILQTFETHIIKEIKGKREISPDITLNTGGKGALDLKLSRSSEFMGEFSKIQSKSSVSADRQDDYVKIPASVRASEIYVSIYTDSELICESVPVYRGHSYRVTA